MVFIAFMGFKGGFWLLASVLNLDRTSFPNWQNSLGTDLKPFLVILGTAMRARNGLVEKNEIVKVEQNNGVRNVYIKVLKSLCK